MLRRLRIEEGWFTVLLTWSLVLIAALAIIDAELIEGTSILPSIATLSVLTGLALAKSRFSGRTALLIALVAMVVNAVISSLSENASRSATRGSTAPTLSTMRRFMAPTG